MSLQIRTIKQNYFQRKCTDYITKETNDMKLTTSTNTKYKPKLNTK